MSTIRGAEAISGVYAANVTMEDGASGCTVIVCPEGATGGVDVRGGAPATRETDLLRPEETVNVLHAVVLSGGSAYGLATSCGVAEELERRGIGLDVGVGVVPIVSSACLFDLMVGDPKVRPSATEGAEPGIMKRKPRDSRDGIFSGGLGVDTLVQGVIIAALTLLSYFIGHYLEFGTFDISQVLADPKAGIHGMTMAFLTLSMVEMFHSLNMRSRRESIFRLKKQNLWLWGSFAVALILTFVVIETPLSHAFGFAEISIREYAIAMGLAFVIIPIVEIEKAIMRAVEKGK